MSQEFPVLVASQFRDRAEVYGTSGTKQRCPGENCTASDFVPDTANLPQFAYICAQCHLNGWRTRGARIFQPGNPLAYADPT